MLDQTHLGSGLRTFVHEFHFGLCLVQGVEN